MRRRVLIPLLAITTTTIAAPASLAGSSTEPTAACRVGLRAAAGPHAVGFHARCCYELRSLKIKPDSKLTGIRERVKITGSADPEDAFACSRASRNVVDCAGSAGRGARIEGRFEVRGPACGISANATVWGGVDCDGGDACIEIAYIGAFGDLRPRGC